MYSPINLCWTAPPQFFFIPLEKNPKNPNKFHGNCDTICIGREIQSLPYAGLFLFFYFFAGHFWTGHFWTANFWTGHFWLGHFWPGHFRQSFLDGTVLERSILIGSLLNGSLFFFSIFLLFFISLLSTV